MDQADLTPILAALPLPAFVVGDQERILMANATGLALLGEGIIGRHPAIAMRNPALLQAIADTAADGAVRQARVALSRDSQEETFIVSISAIGVRLVLCIFRDVSEEERAAQIRRDFVANVSHELRTPLTALMGFIETLKHAAREDPVARDRFLAIMEQEASRMNRLVQDLLHLSRVEADERVRPRERVDLGDILRSTIDSLQPLADGAGARVELVGAQAALPVPGDSDQLTQVFTNLVENAVKYGPAGQEVLVAVRREDSIRGPAIRVDVTDRGEGIDEIHLPRLTERFYRVDTHRSREKGGTGLGLAIVKHIVNRHRGWLKIESAVGEGSTFSVILPEG
ncbi:ATP-binding protein [Tabrizicola sp.]|uniref:sensor histidine kinase n=1 Tax=Tabrizicola sp. TaxID=2005166 RepID=UPI00286D3F6B|nr:ATP-binding protein [Tabrizicola sp.]